MPRPHKCRLIHIKPPSLAFKPLGIPASSLESVELKLDELEAIVLTDLEGLYHEEAAERMNVSRATFSRVIQKARKKIAEALIKGKILIIKGGNVTMYSEGVTNDKNDLST